MGDTHRTERMKTYLYTRRRLSASEAGVMMKVNKLSIVVSSDKLQKKQSISDQL